MGRELLGRRGCSAQTRGRPRKTRLHRDTSITSNPPASTTSTSASFAFGASEAGSTFECRLEPTGTWAACSSPKQYTGLTVGAHSFAVRATDAADNTDATPATYDWTVTASQSLVELARGPPTTASSIESAAYGAGNAVDGNPATRWSSRFANNQWWQVDLGGPKDISRVELDWEAAYASSYRIVTSTDGTNFTQAAVVTATGPGTKVTTFVTRSARYVRVEITKRATQWGASFWEARVFGSSSAGMFAAARTAPKASRGFRWVPGAGRPQLSRSGARGAS